MKENFYRVLLESNEREIVKSYMEAFELDDKFVRLVMQSKYSGEFMEFLQNLRNQQAKPVDVDATAPEPIDTPVEEAPASEAETPVDEGPVEEAPASEAETPVDEAPVNEAPASETETPSVAFPEFLFQKISSERLIEGVKTFAKSKGEKDAPEAVRVIENVIFTLKYDAKVVFWGELFTRRSKVKQLFNLENKKDFEVFTRNFEREMKVSLNAYFPGLEDALKPYLEAYAQEQAEKATQDKARELLRKKNEFLHTKLEDLRESELLANKAMQGCKGCLTRFYKKPGSEKLKDLTLADLSEFSESEMIGNLGKTLARYVAGLCENINSGIFPKD